MKKADPISVASIRLRSAALEFAKVANGPVLDSRDTACLVANRKLLRAAREYARALK